MICVSVNKKVLGFVSFCVPVIALKHNSETRDSSGMSVYLNVSKYFSYLIFFHNFLC